MKIILVSALIALVNPFIGSGGHGHVFVGADVPHGMVHAGPMNTTQGWDWCSGYNAGDSTLAGYAQTRLGGTGIADYGDFVILPQTSRDTCSLEYISAGSMTARPGYCELVQSPSGIRTRITASARTAEYVFEYPKGSEAFLKIDLTRGAKSLMFRKGFKQGSFEQLSEMSFRLYRKTDLWTFNREIWGLMKFSRPVVSVETDGETYAVLGFGKIRKLDLSFAISQQGAGGLEGNLAEAGNFKQTLKSAESWWAEELSSIVFNGISPEVDTIFQTALYHTMVSPQLYSDASQPDEYTVFSLWDTYRAVHPLFDITDWRAGAYVNSLLDIYDRTGLLPVWPLAGEDTYCMVGVHSITVMVDAALKGIEGVDPQRVLDACKKMTEQPVYGMGLWDSYGYLPADKVNYSVSVELEYCINAQAIASLAFELGDWDAAYDYTRRASRYARHFDPETGFMRAVLSDGSFRVPFDPSFSLHDEADYVEGNAWQYTFLVPQDVDALAELFGGPQALESKLDDLFSASSALNEGASADITGMVGQYAHGNEPSHHIAYLYTLLGKPHKTARMVRRLCGEFYSTSAYGLAGNEDCGQMSAWYVFSALGFYPVNPVSGEFVFGSPLCHDAVIHTSAGKDFLIHVRNNSKDNIYIQRITLNGEELRERSIYHDQIMEGGDLVIEMGPYPQIWY